MQASTSATTEIQLACIEELDPRRDRTETATPHRFGTMGRRKAQSAHVQFQRKKKSAGGWKPCGHAEDYGAKVPRQVGTTKIGWGRSIEPDASRGRALQAKRTHRAA